MSAAKFFIPTLPGLPEDSTLTMYGGHIPSAPPVNGVADTTSDAHLFFFLLRNRHIADTERTVFWFNGGPGCSSFDGSMMEIGPLRVIPGSDGKLKETEGAWNEYANVIFVDQPVGTGYSYTESNGFVHELNVMAAHVVEFMSKFYDIFPEFATHDTYIAGESYAGQYIPYIAEAILATTELPTKLKGLLIGNGWIDPLSQYPAYLDFALQAGVVKKGSEVETRIRKETESCMTELERIGAKNVKIHNAGCENILGSITDSTIQSVNGQNMCVNNYDVRLTDTHPACGMNWPPDLADITPYLQRSDVKAAFHASRKSGNWVECNGNVGANFWVGYSKPSVTILPKLLEQVPILLFAGDQDLICNHVGIERLVDNLAWAGETGFGNASAQDWSVDGKHAGTWRSARGLTYVKIADASHMVPYDQPLAAHDMFLRFVGADLLGAAGPAAQVPSRVGDEQEAVLGNTHLNGTAVGSTAGELESNGRLPADALKSDSVIEALVNAGSAIVIIALMLFACLVFYIVRRRVSRRSKGHTRNQSSNLGRGVPVAEDEDGPHEMERLVTGAEYRDRAAESSAEERDMYIPGAGVGKKGELAVDEEIFNLGESDEEGETKPKHG
ncbi:alpha/beta-hydrolase [Meredithblackwellia eburnea MCA 4105]